MQIADGVHRFETRLGERINCVYVFAGSERSLLFDTTVAPVVEADLIPQLHNAGLDPAAIRYVVNSHCDWDHTGGNGVIRRLLADAVLMCHELDRPMVESAHALITRRYGEFSEEHGIDESDEGKALIGEMAQLVPIDVGLRGGERFHLGSGWHVDVLHTPGHSWGHLSVYDPRSGSLAIGDATLGHAVLLADGSPAFPPTYRYVDSYLSTIHRFEGMRVDHLLTSHYPVYSGGAVGDFLADSAAYAARVDEALLDAIGDAGPVTMRALTEQLGPSLGEWPRSADEYLVHPFGGHLERMEQFGKVRRVPHADGRVAYVAGAAR